MNIIPGKGSRKRMFEETQQKENYIVRCFCDGMKEDVALFQWSISLTLLNQSRLLSSGDTQGTGYVDVRIYTQILFQIQTISASPRFNVSLNCPSKLTDAVHRLSIDTSIRNTVLSGNNICRNESVCGQIGVIKRLGVSGCTIDPPADIEYAVDPVGVAMISPSACTVVIRSVSI